MSRKPKPDTSLWDNASYRRRAAALRQEGYSNPRATCWLCGLTLEEGPAHRDGSPSRWVADHVIPSAGERSPLRLAHSVCNGRRSVSQRRGGRKPGRGPTWGNPGLEPGSPNA